MSVPDSPIPVAHGKRTFFLLLQALTALLNPFPLLLFPLNPVPSISIQPVTVSETDLSEVKEHNVWLVKIKSALWGYFSFCLQTSSLHHLVSGSNGKDLENLTLPQPFLFPLINLFFLIFLLKLASSMAAICQESALIIQLAAVAGPRLSMFWHTG